MKHDRIADAERELQRPEGSASEPPRIDYLACGARCDIFWWARRKAGAAGDSGSRATAPDAE